MSAVVVLGWICAGSSIALYMSCLMLCRQIWKKGNAEEFSMFPYVAMCASCTIWLKYGLLKPDLPLIFVNIFGSSLQVFVLFNFYFFSHNRNAIFKQIILGCLFVFPALTYVRFAAPSRELALHHLGFYCTLMSILSYGSPLSAVGTVISSRSTEAMSFPLSFLNFVVGLEWSAYGILQHDFNIVLPNIIGTMLSIFQVSLFVVYKRKVKTRTVLKLGTLISLDVV